MRKDGLTWNAWLKETVPKKLKSYMVIGNILNSWNEMWKLPGDVLVLTDEEKTTW
jgi:hypothetical protein